MHDIRVIIAGEHEAGSAHVGRELVNLVKTKVGSVSATNRVSEITDNKVVRFCIAELWKL
jgi:hypothetical protein